VCVSLSFKQALLAMRFNIKNQETTSFKKRYKIGYKLPKLIFGDFSLTLCKSYNLEYIYLYNFKKSLKKYYLFKKKTGKKVWVFLHKNYPLTKKSKNARMGKGKGSLTRYCARILQNHNLFEFSGFNLSEVFKIKKIFKKKVNINTKIYSNFFLNKQYIYSCKNQYFFFFKRYRS
jgi:ribosomal protein L16/L10AE